MHLEADGRTKLTIYSFEKKLEFKAAKKAKKLSNLESNSKNVSTALKYYLWAEQTKSDLLKEKCREFIQKYFKNCFGDWEKAKDFAFKISQFTEQKKQIIPLSLDLNKRKSLRPDFFEMLKWFSESLISLKLNSSQICLVDGDLKNLSPFIHLSALSLNCNIQSEGLSHLKLLTKLLALKLCLSSKYRGNKLAYLRSMTNLVYLNLSGSEIDDKDLASLQPLTRLLTLNLSRCQSVTNVGLQSLSHLPLVTLTVGGNKLRLKSGIDAGFNVFQQFSKLICLHVHRTTINGSELEKLKPLGNLTFLDLSESPFLKDWSLVYLKPLTALTSLALNHCSIEGWGLKDLHQLPHLRSLSLKKNEINDGCLNYLLTDLSSLNLAKCKKIRNLGSANFGLLTNLTCLNISESGINDEGIKNLQANSQLRTLNLSGCAITDDGLDHLKNLSNLTEVNLSNCELLTEFGLNFINNHLKFNFSRIQNSRSTIMQYPVQNSRNPSTDPSLADWGVINDDTDTKEKIDVLFRQNELLLMKLNKQSEDNKLLKANQQELTSNLHDLNERVENLGKVILLKDAKIQELTNNIQSLEKNAKDLENTIKLNREKLKEETQQKAILEEQLAEKEKQIDLADSTNKNLIKELKNENLRLSHELRDSISKIEKKIGPNAKNMTAEEIAKLQSKVITKNEKIACVAIPVIGAAVGSLGGPPGAIIGAAVGVVVDGCYVLIMK